MPLFSRHAVVAGRRRGEAVAWMGIHTLYDAILELCFHAQLTEALPDADVLQELIDVSAVLHSSNEWCWIEVASPHRGHSGG